MKIPRIQSITFIFLLLNLIILIFQACLFNNQSYSSFNSAKLSFLNIGEGDATLLQIDGKSFLIDAGSPGSGILDTLQNRGIDTLQWVLITHHHLDHFGGIFDLIHQIEIKKFLIGSDPLITPEWNSLDSLLHHSKIPSQIIQRGDSIPISSEFLPRILWPSPRWNFEGNNASLVLSLTLGNSKILFTGDIEAEAESLLVNLEPNLQHTILKVPHHGSKSSSTPRFLQAVHPSWCIISAGIHNDYGHPHAEALADLSNELGTDSLHLLRTDLDGTIQFRIFEDAVERKE